MKKSMLIYAFIVFLFVSCNKENNDVELKSTGYEITLASICGWCAGGDSMLVTEVETYYETNKPCDDLVEKKETPTTKKDWEDLMNLLDFDEFQKIDINTCNVCADGCDTWITVNDGTISHTIRFGYNDSLTIEAVQPFIDKLMAIRDGISGNLKD